MRTVITLACICFLLSCTNNVPSDLTSSHRQIKTNSAETERNEPSRFLSVNGEYRKNWIGQWICEGNITNTASAATYKDVVLRIRYFSKTGSEMGYQEKTVFEYLKPNGSQHFKVKLKDADSAYSMKLEVVSALNVEE